MDSGTKKALTHTKVFSKRSVIMRSFVGGIAWGVGSVIGATLIVALFLTFLHSIGWIPVIGDVANTISQSINRNTLPKTGP